jgi:predicted enzyme involved in methoxymalonyl-ACP biosynthesis
MASPSLDTYVIECNDRFGNYGIIGFGIVDTATPRLVDLMFSCRIQGKRVEHAVLSFLLKRFVSKRRLDFYANYRRTSKNAPAGKVFDELGFQTVEENEGVVSFVFRNGLDIPDDQIAEIKTSALNERSAAVALSTE